MVNKPLFLGGVRDRGGWLNSHKNISPIKFEPLVQMIDFLVITWSLFGGTKSHIFGGVFWAFIVFLGVSSCGVKKAWPYPTETSSSHLMAIPSQKETIVFKPSMATLRENPAKS